MTKIVSILILLFPLTLFTACDDSTTTVQTEICNNETDDDGDGHVDCDDQDCWTHQACTDPLEICDNGTDDDDDGFIDCNDLDCVDECEYGETCDNGVDDDGDGFVDCEDQDCWGHQVCNTTPEICGNEIDDDLDGEVDCDDPDCEGDPLCVTQTEHCGNGVDDDGDGMVDCNDPDCATDTEYCGGGAEWDCADGIDNDENGLIDCDDPNCQWSSPNCAREICDNGYDDDSDGSTDCDDPDCEGDPACVPPGEQICNDFIDDDSDGYTDCEDRDCIGNSYCGECDAVNDSGCATGQCYFDRTIGYQGSCTAALGTGNLYDSCNTATDCVPGLFCNQQTRECNALCLLGDMCVGGNGTTYQCIQVWDTSPYGYCQ
ncbi:hypothetical protein KKF84_12355 [Myxococcota bacterium]|nr:hypothetical protein [Myxococcota bacterium]MBU1536107.1 hypothetical protein [Myxococcota bacterium]